MLRSVLAREGGREAGDVGGGIDGAILRLSVAERERERLRWRHRGRDEFFVPTPESLAWLDSVSLPIVLTAAAVALFTKLLMMIGRCQGLGYRGDHGYFCWSGRKC